MDYKYIEQTLERYFNAETSLEEERILRAFFSQQDIPQELEPWRGLFTMADDDVLGDEFDRRILALTGQEAADGGSPASEPRVKARVVSLSQRLMPLYKAAAVVAIILTLGGALQAPFDQNWSTPEDFASLQQQMDSVTVSEMQAIGDVTTDSTQVLRAAGQVTR